MFVSASPFNNVNVLFMDLFSHREFSGLTGGEAGENLLFSHLRRLQNESKQVKFREKINVFMMRQ